MSRLLAFLQALLRAIRSLFGRGRPTPTPTPPPADARMNADRYVRPGDTEDQVTRAIGRPDTIEANQWIYTIDPRRGWRVTFSPSGTVEDVDLWIR